MKDDYFCKFKLIMNSLYPYTNYVDILKTNNKFFQYGVLWTICEDLMRIDNSGPYYQFKDWLRAELSTLHYMIDEQLMKHMLKDYTPTELEQPFHSFFNLVKHCITINIINKVIEDDPSTPDFIRKLAQIVNYVLFHPNEFNETVEQKQLSALVKDAANRTLMMYSEKWLIENKIPLDKKDSLIDEYLQSIKQ